MRLWLVLGGSDGSQKAEGALLLLLAAERTDFLFT